MFFFSLIFSLLLPLRGIHPSAVQSSPGPQAAKACTPLQWFWLRGGLIELLPSIVAQTPPERFPEVHGERQVDMYKFLESNQILKCVCFYLSGDIFELEPPQSFMCIYDPLDVA